MELYTLECSLGLSYIHDSLQHGIALLTLLARSYGRLKGRLETAWKVLVKSLRLVVEAVSYEPITILFFT